MWENDAHRLAKHMASDFADKPAPVWDERCPPSVRIIDCVLSLRRHYNRVVKPRVEAFATRFPEVRSCADLRDRVKPNPAGFARAALNIDSPSVGNSVWQVSEYLHDMQSRFTGESELDRLRAWANWARPGDYLALDVHRFALAGFQYLRMQFGAETVKPDVHIVRYVSEALGRQVSEVHALYILERAAELSRVSARTLDGLIWESRTGRTLRPAPPSSP